MIDSLGLFSDFFFTFGITIKRKSMKIFSLPVLGFLLFSLVSSCSPKADSSQEFTINTVLTASGPLFEGSNTFQSEISSNIADFIKQNNLTEEQIVDIALVSASASPVSSENLDLFESISLQISSDNFPMQNVAIANNIPQNLKKADFKIADSQKNLKSILFESKTYVIADATIKEDFDDDLNIGIEMIFSINYIKK
jgi:hypothetical protein